MAGSDQVHREAAGLHGKVALVCDSMSAYGGAERVIEQILALYPHADVFSLVDVLPRGQRGFLGGRPVRTSFLQRFPGVHRYYRSLLSLWPIAIEQFDVTKYDLVISSHHSVAYGVLTHSDQLHVAYVYSPMRYAWDLQHEYLREAKLETGLKSMIARRMLHSARIWDFCAAQRPDIIMTDSEFVGSRMRRIHRRDSKVVYPPVAVEAFPPPRPAAGREGYYLSVGRLVPYKRTELLVRAFAQMPGRRLKVVGSGPEANRIKAALPPNVELLGNVPTEEVHRLMRGAEAYLFAGIEDFGITPVEVQAAGTPVIAFHRGGLTETVLGLDHPQPTGLFFEEQTEAAVIAAIEQFEQPQIRARLSPENCVANAAQFSAARFREEFKVLVSEGMQDFRKAAPRQSATRAAALKVVG